MLIGQWIGFYLFMMFEAILDKWAYFYFVKGPCWPLVFVICDIPSELCMFGYLFQTCTSPLLG